MLLWTNLPDIRPSASYLSAWLDHLDGSIAHRLQDRIFARDWRWLVMASNPHLSSVQNDAFTARYSAPLSSFWMTFQEIERLSRRSAPVSAQSRAKSSFWESVRVGALDRCLRCKEFALHPPPSPPPSRDFYPFTFAPDDAVRFAHGLALRVGLLTGHELRHTLETVGNMIQKHAGTLPGGTDVSWRTGMATLGLLMRQWPEHWPLWGDEHISLRRSAVSSLVPSPAQELFLFIRDAKTTAEMFPSDCRLFASIVQNSMMRPSATGKRTGRDAPVCNMSQQAPRPADVPSQIPLF